MMKVDRRLLTFWVELAGPFHTFKLLDSMGRNITNVLDAADFAESEFHGDWNSVFNEEESLDRGNWFANGN